VTGSGLLGEELLRGLVAEGDLVLLVQEPFAIEVLGGVDDPPQQPRRESGPDADTDDRQELGELALPVSREAISDATSS
jgi:hypothetical protein